MRSVFAIGQFSTRNSTFPLYGSAPQPESLAPVFFWEEIPGLITGGLEVWRERERQEAEEERRRAAEAAAALARAQAQEAAIRAAAAERAAGGIPTWALVGGGLAAAGLIAFLALR